jgi:hypothetical protein
MMYTNLPPSSPTPGSTAFRVGATAGIVLILIHVMTWLITQDVGTGDALGWIIGLFVIFMAARTAATRQRQAQSQAIEPIQGTQGAGIGAALITTFTIWAFLTIRNLAGGGDAFTDVWGVLRIPLDVFFALGLGAWGARLRSYEGSQGENPFYTDW